MSDEILEMLHDDHEEVAGLIDRVLESDDNEQRQSLFRTVMAKLLAHSHAEQSVLYTKLQKSDDYRSRGFAYQGENEHQIVENQLQRMLRAANMASEEWTAQMKVLRELVRHHVKEEEENGFARARREFDDGQREKLGQEFLQEKHRLLSDA